MKFVHVFDDVGRPQSPLALLRGNFYSTSVEINFAPMHVVHLERQRAVPSARRVDSASAFKDKALYFAGKIVLWENQKLIQRVRGNFLGNHMQLCVQRR